MIKISNQIEVVTMASVNGMSKDGQKTNNIYAILNLLYKHGAMARKDIAEIVKLTPATVTLLTNEMIQIGLLAEGGEIADNNRAGRRKIQVDINYRYGYIAGIYIEQSKFIVALAYMNGELISNVELDFDIGVTPELLADQFKDIVDRMIEDNNLTREEFCYVGVSIIGYVDTERGVSENSFNLFKENIDLKSLFELRFGVPVTVDNNVRSLAIAEIDFNRNQQNINGLFIKHSPGLGGAIIIDNSIYSGAHHHSGELGHYTVNVEGKQCVCGKKGCVSTIVSRSALINKAAEILNPDTTPVLWRLCKGNPKYILMDMMVKSAQDGDLPICRIMESAASLLAMVVENSMKLINGDIVITFGELLKNEWFHQKFEQNLDIIANGTRTYKLRKSIIDESELWKAPIAIAVRQLLKLLSQNTNGVKKS